MENTLAYRSSVFKRPHDPDKHILGKVLRNVRAARHVRKVSENITVVTRAQLLGSRHIAILRYL